MFCSFFFANTLISECMKIIDESIKFFPPYIYQIVCRMCLYWNYLSQTAESTPVTYNLCCCNVLLPNGVTLYHSIIKFKVSTMSGYNCWPQMEKSLELRSCRSISRRLFLYTLICFSSTDQKNSKWGNNNFGPMTSVKSLHLLKPVVTLFWY